MHRHRNAKIVATLGPASSDRETIQALFAAGVDVFRLNFSHGDHADHRRRINTTRAIERDSCGPIGVLLDLQEPKLRLVWTVLTSIRLRVIRRPRGRA